MVFELPEAVVTRFASRHHRLHHALWHGLRDMWVHPSLGDDAKAEITKLNWAPPRPALRWIKGGWMPLTLNGSGVDFLFMHREMIAEFDESMLQAKADPNVGWHAIPEPGLPESNPFGTEVPPTWRLPDNLGWLERRFESPSLS